MRFSLLTAGVVALAACSSPDAPSPTAQGAHAQAAASGNNDALRSPAARLPRAIAGLPDRGTLVAYTTQTPVKHSAYTWHPVQISEAHALRAIATGELTIEAPDGTPIQLKYDHHIEHPDGNWTWIGRPEGAQPGTEAIITFGEKAVFGTIPNRGRMPLRIGSSHGYAWVMETDPKRLALVAGAHPKAPDAVVPPALAGARDRATSLAAAQPQQLTATGAVPEAATVDVVIGYTNTFASRLGGTSQAVTRLTFLTDVTNQAFTSSETVARVRLVGTVALDYPDATDNEVALRALTGVTCIELSGGNLDCDPATIPAALMPLVTLRDTKNADLVSLVRNFSDPENQGCGIAWLLGGGMAEEITKGEVDVYGVSVVSDSNGRGGGAFPDNGYVCRDETFAHELGHNFGSGHDAEASMGGDGVLDDSDRGVFRYSLGFKSDANGFFTVMAYGESGMAGYRVFSNPRITYCGGYACGVAEEADNARSISQTAPVIAGHAATLVGPRARADFNGDSASDILWRHASSGENQIWRSADASTKQSILDVGASAWTIVGTGDYNGDGRADILWRHTGNGQNALWRSGSHATQQTLPSVPDLTWRIVGSADFDGDGDDDVLWRHDGTGANRIWRSANPNTQLAIAAVAKSEWRVAGVGDFNGDGRDDIAWRNAASGANTIWRSASNATQQAMPTVPDQNWRIAGSGDFDGDGSDDLLWRHATSGANRIWRSGNSATQQVVATVGNPAWKVAAVCDFDADGRADVLWRSSANGANEIWRSASASSKQVVPTVSSTAWVVEN